MMCGVFCTSRRQMDRLHRRHHHRPLSYPELDRDCRRLVPFGWGRAPPRPQEKMFTILIQEKGGEQRRMGFNKPEVTIGRVQGNDIVLPKGNVSKRHARIVLKDGKFIIVDLKSTNGTYVNGRKITSPLVVKDSDKIYIGDFIVGVDESASDADGGSETTTPPPAGDRERAAVEARPPRPTELAPQ